MTVGSGRRLDLETAPGVLLAGMALGALLAAGLAVIGVLARFASLTAASAAPLPAAAPPPPALEFPVEGISRDRLVDSFDEARGARIHHAIDILAPRNSAVHAVHDGRIVRLVSSPAGGITLYLRDSVGRYCYYYAHLERYADGVREGRDVRRGDVIGYVGTTGNAPARSPHLHFAVLELAGATDCASGTAVDPFPLLR